MAAEVTIAATHPTETWAALIAAVTVIVALVKAFFKRLTDDQKAETLARELMKKELDAKLDLGITTFSNIDKQIVAITGDIKTMKEEEQYNLEQLDKIELDISLIDKRVLVIETEHKHCQDNIRK